MWTFDFYCGFFSVRCLYRVLHITGTIHKLTQHESNEIFVYMQHTACRAFSLFSQFKHQSSKNDEEKGANCLHNLINKFVFCSLSSSLHIKHLYSKPVDMYKVTSTETGCTPSWETPSVPVSRSPLVPGLKRPSGLATWVDLQSRLVLFFFFFFLFLFSIDDSFWFSNRFLNTYSMLLIIYVFYTFIMFEYFVQTKV